MRWNELERLDEVCLYAGDIPFGYPQTRTHIGLSMNTENRNHIKHDITKPFLLKDESVSLFQSEDVFEHIEYEKMIDVLNEIHRVLKPGALCRISVPDYNCDILYNRSIKTQDGKIVFDPGGGGKLVVDPKKNAFNIIGGGHVWFPTYKNTKRLIKNSKFGHAGKYEFLHCYADSGVIIKDIDYSLGYVLRTPDHDERVQRPRRPMSIVVDLYKKKIS